jgi:hypothetical protein
MRRLIRSSALISKQTMQSLSSSNTLTVSRPGDGDDIRLVGGVECDLIQEWDCYS